MISDSHSAGDGRDFNAESAPNVLRLMNEVQLKGLFFDAIRACHVNAIKNILSVNRSLVTAKMYGYEGTDVYDTIKNSKTHRCYTYSGVERDGFFYPLHVSAEAGHKRLTLLLVKAGADVNQPDYRGDLAEAKCNGDAQHAFFELKGMVFESQERFEGKLDREERRTGSGVLYFKPEGYTSVERVLFRGSFKFGLFHGHGTLYHEGLDTMRYVGRFKLGEMHGRGIEFDRHGQKIFVGNFRHNQRDGRGEEYSEGVLTYKGEFGKNTRHGFGVAIFGENHRYVGRFENNMMAGVGIFCHPTKDRFEGMFYNNKPDGMGSFYEAEQVGKQETQSHALWQKGKKIKELSTPFVPNIIDLPDDRSQSLLTAISAEEDKIMKGLELEASEDSTPHSPNREVSDHSSSTSASTSNASETQIASDWKQILAKYCRLTPDECRAIGLVVNEDAKQFLREISDDSESKELGDSEGEVNEEREDITNDLNGVHFIDYTALFVAYLYIYSAAKVFDGRLASTQLDETAPDFEVVQNIVIDAVETYNDLWEAEFKAQEDAKQTGAADHDSDKVKQVEQKRQIFMTEREKREEELKRQRTELAAKKGTGQLDHWRDVKIRELVINGLEEELMKIVSTHNQGSSQSNLDLTTQFSGNNSIRDKFGLWDASMDNVNGLTHKIGSMAAEMESGEPNQFAAELLHIIRTSTAICSTNI